MYRNMRKRKKMKIERKKMKSTEIKTKESDLQYIHFLKIDIDWRLRGSHVRRSIEINITIKITVPSSNFNWKKMKPS